MTEACITAEDTATTTGVSPLKAARQHCLDCCNGRAAEVAACPSRACSLWAFRFGRRADDGAKADVADIQLHPQERPALGSQFHGEGGTALRAIRRRCLDCSGSQTDAVKACAHGPDAKRNPCDLWPFRLGKNPNFRITDERRAVLAQQLASGTRKI